MLSFKKDELGFLSLFNMCQDTKSLHGDKVKIANIKGTKDIIFCQRNTKGIINFSILKDKNVNDEKFSFIFEIDKLYKMSSLCGKEEDIVIKKEGINFGTKSSYKFESYDDLNDLIDDAKIYDTFVSGFKKSEVLEIKDFDLIKNIEFSIGAEGFNNIAILKDEKEEKTFFVTSDGESITSSILTTNDIQEDNWIDNDLYKITKLVDKDNKEFKVDINRKDGTYFYSLGNNIYTIVPLCESNIFNIFKEENKSLYEHKNKFSFKKHDFINALEKIMVVTSVKYKNRIFIYLEKDSVTIENKEGISGKEVIDAKIDKDLQDKYFLIQAPSLLKAIKELNNENITIRIDSDIDNCNVVKVEAEGVNKFFIVNLLEKI